MGQFTVLPAVQARSVLLLSSVPNEGGVLFVERTIPLSGAALTVISGEFTAGSPHADAEICCAAPAFFNVTVAVLNVPTVPD